ncbi:MAG: preprotein translocase subunit YajC [Acidobacteriia bacterium]|nr:preprotein translocase subunit YajC [Terriglobia bacterium]
MNSSFLSLLAQASPGGSSTLIGFLPLIAIGFIFYFLLILPAQRRQKKTREMLGGLKTGDKVVTSSGILGTIAGMDGNVVTLRIADQVKVRLLKSAVVGLQAPEDAEK